MSSFRRCGFLICSEECGVQDTPRRRMRLTQLYSDPSHRGEKNKYVVGCKTWPHIMTKCGDSCAWRQRDKAERNNDKVAGVGEARD